MPWLTGSQVKQAVADALQQTSVANLPARWDRICEDAAADAMGDILGHFGGMGYTETQITDWTRLTSLHKLQSLYWAFVHGAGLHAYDDRWVNKYDQRPFKDMVITGAAGVTQGQGDPGFVEVGRLSTTDDLYTRDMLL